MKTDLKIVFIGILAIALPRRRKVSVGFAHLTRQRESRKRRRKDKFVQFRPRRSRWPIGALLLPYFNNGPVFGLPGTETAISGIALSLPVIGRTPHEMAKHGLFFDILDYRVPERDLRWT